MTWPPSLGHLSPGTRVRVRDTLSYAGTIAGYRDGLLQVLVPGERTPRTAHPADVRATDAAPAGRRTLMLTRSSSTLALRLNASLHAR